MSAVSRRSVGINPVWFIAVAVFAVATLVACSSEDPTPTSVPPTSTPIPPTATPVEVEVP